jgi:hypothetical protein
VVWMDVLGRCTRSVEAKGKDPKEEEILKYGGPSKVSQA